MDECIRYAEGLTTQKEAGSVGEQSVGTHPAAASLGAGEKCSWGTDPQAQRPVLRPCAHWRLSVTP